jgi:hypothetical protein
MIAMHRLAPAALLAALGLTPAAFAADNTPGAEVAAATAQATTPAASPQAGTGWVSDEQMRRFMIEQGVPMPPAPAVAGGGPSEAPAAPALTPGPASKEDLARVLAVRAEMTPEQQQACFAFSLWQAGRSSCRYLVPFPCPEGYCAPTCLRSLTWT